MRKIEIYEVAIRNLGKQNNYHKNRVEQRVGIRVSAFSLSNAGGFREENGV